MAAQSRWFLLSVAFAPPGFLRRSPPRSACPRCSWGHRTPCGCGVVFCTRWRGAVGWRSATRTWAGSPRWSSRPGLTLGGLAPLVYAGGLLMFGRTIPALLGAEDTSAPGGPERPPSAIPRGAAEYKCREHIQRGVSGIFYRSPRRCQGVLASHHGQEVSVVYAHGTLRMRRHGSPGTSSRPPRQSSQGSGASMLRRWRGARGLPGAEWLARPLCRDQGAAGGPAMRAARPGGTCVRSPRRIKT